MPDSILRQAIVDAIAFLENKTSLNVDEINSLDTNLRKALHFSTINTKQNGSNDTKEASSQ